MSIQPDERFDDFPVWRSFSGPGWALEDCEAVARAHPKTFKRPAASHAPSSPSEIWCDSISSLPIPG